MTPKEARDLLSARIAATLQLARDEQDSVVDGSKILDCIDDLERAIREEYRRHLGATLPGSSPRSEVMDFKDRVEREHEARIRAPQWEAGIREDERRREAERRRREGATKGLVPSR